MTRLFTGHLSQDTVGSSASCPGRSRALMSSSGLRTEIWPAGEDQRTESKLGDNMNRTEYIAPSITDLGDFTELTLCTPWGSCRDFLGCGRAPICI